MASTLCVKARNDIHIAPGMADPLPSGAQAAKPNMRIVDLVKLMRATCLDVAESAANSDIQLANSTICVARALKMSGASKEDQPDMEGLPEELGHMAWGKLLKYVEDPFEFTWLPAQECTLRALMYTRPIECSEAALAMLHDDLLRRSAGSVPSDLGALLKYRISMTEIGQFCYRRHTYLFETAVVVMDDGPNHGFTAISMNRKLDHPLELKRLIHLHEITAMDPIQKSGGGIGYIYGLSFRVRGDGSDFTIAFGDLPGTIGWATTIRRLQCRGKSEEVDPTEMEEVAEFESFAAIMQAFRWQLPIIQSLGQVVYHGVVGLVGSKKAIGFIQLVLFEHALVFIHGLPADVKRILFAPRILSITEAGGDKVTLTYMTEHDDFIRVEEFCFQPKESDSDVDTWLQKLYTFAPNASTYHEVHRKIRRVAQKHAQYEASTSASERADKVLVTGLATLHATPVPNELNISVAILPEFESDGIATYLIAHTLELAFEKLDAHRIQARVVHSSANPAQTVRAIRFLLHLGFTHEGVRRRSALHPTERQWADVSVLAMLELDWVTRAVGTPAKGTLWDEMFVRHQREREVLLKMEGSKELKRTRSMETVRDLHSMNDGIPSASMVSPSVGCPTVASDTTSQVSVPTTTSSWDGMSDSTSLQSGAAKVLSAASLSSADDAADEYEEWDLEEDYSDDDDGSEPKE